MAKRGSDPKRAAARVGVRELRQNLSVYLDRVKEGERLEVTEHGRTVALLVPLPPEQDPIARLVAEGKMIPAKGSLGDWLRENPPLPALPGQKTLTEILLEMRDEEEF
ncbi:MAG TPA: type II toxin-antitoxin system prevent-host-death family antitoxin [Thermoanaerobaculia bacterium]|jgi:prevent-host-death family protein